MVWCDYCGNNVKVLMHAKQDGQDEEVEICLICLDEQIHRAKAKRPLAKAMPKLGAKFDIDAVRGSPKYD